MALTDETQAAFAEFISPILQALSKAASMLLNVEVQVKFLGIGESTIKTKQILAPEDTLIIQAALEKNSVFLITNKEHASTLAALMMGKTELEAFDEEAQQAYSSALSQGLDEALNQSGQIKLSNYNLSFLESGKSLDLDIENNSRFDVIFEANLGSSQIQMILNIEEDLIKKYSKISEEYVNVGDFMGADFAEIIDSHDPDDVNEKHNLNLLMDIRLGLIVELGRTEMHLKEILKLTKGSIIELDRLSGEPVDLFVNNKLIARGEVVVIDDNFGLRITQLAGLAKPGEKEIGLLENFADA